MAVTDGSVSLEALIIRPSVASMLLERISIRNYRSIRDRSFDLPRLSVLVGKNDAGKSNIISAIRLLIEGAKADIKAEDFYEPAGEVVFEGTFSGVTELLPLCQDAHRPRIEERIHDRDKITLRRVAARPGDLGKLEIRNADGQFTTATGIENAFKVLLPIVVMIEPLADVADEMKGTQKDALGKLSAELMTGLQPTLEPILRDSLRQATSLLKRGDGEDRRAQQLRDLETELSTYLKDTFPSASLELQVDLPSVPEIISRVEIEVRESGCVDPVQRRGSGLQRSLYLSFLRAIAARMAQQNGEVRRRFILLFEEPESFLHPDAQQKMQDTLKTIASRAQAIISTHSPLLVCADSIENVLRIERNTEAGQPKPCTTKFGPIQLATLDVDDRELLRVFALQRSSRFLFAGRVLLVEGIADEVLFAAAAERLGPFSLATNGIAIVEVGGKEAIHSFDRVLSALGIRCIALVDLDFLWNGAGAVLAGNADFLRFSERLQRDAPPPPEGATDAQKRDAKDHRTDLCQLRDLAALRDRVCDLLAERRIYVLRHGEIEHYVGLSRRSKQAYLKAAREIQEGTRRIIDGEDLVRVIDALRV